MVSWLRWQQANTNDLSAQCRAQMHTDAKPYKGQFDYVAWQRGCSCIACHQAMQAMLRCEWLANNWLTAA